MTTPIVQEASNGANGTLGSDATVDVEDDESLQLDPNENAPLRTSD